MARIEACEVWIEQRSEELRAEGTPIEETGRILSDEVQHYFETTVRPRTLAQRIRRNEDAATDVTEKQPITSHKLWERIERRLEKIVDQLKEAKVDEPNEAQRFSLNVHVARLQALVKQGFHDG